MAFVVMGTIALAAALLVAAEMLVQLLPLLVVALVVVVVPRVAERRHRTPDRPVRVPTALVPPATPWCAAWVIVQVSMVPIDAPLHPNSCARRRF